MRIEGEEARRKMEGARVCGPAVTDERWCSCRCIGPVARRSRGERRGRKVAWPTRSGDNGKNRFQADRQLLRYRLSCSLVLPVSLPPTRPPAPPERFLCPESSSSSLVLCLLFALPLSSLLTAETTSGRPASLPTSALPRPFSLLRTPVSQTLAKPCRRQRLSCRSTRPLSVSTEMILVVSSPLSSSYRDRSRSLPPPRFPVRFFNCDF